MALATAAPVGQEKHLGKNMSKHRYIFTYTCVC